METMCARVLNRSVMPNSLQYFGLGLYLARFFCPWDFSGKNTGVGGHFPLSRGSSWPRDRTWISHVSCIAGILFTCWAQNYVSYSFKIKLYFNQTILLKVSEDFTSWSEVPGFWWLCTFFMILKSYRCKSLPFSTGRNSMDSTRLNIFINFLDSHESGSFQVSTCQIKDGEKNEFSFLRVAPE